MISTGNFLLYIAVGALLLAVVGIYLWSERVARRSGKGMPSERRFLVFVVVMLAVNAMAAHWLFWPEILQRFNRYQLEARLDSRPYTMALKQYYPAEYQRVLSEFEQGGHPNAEAIVGIAIRMEAFIGTRLPYASDEAIVAYNHAILSNLQELEKSDPQLCYLYLYPSRSKEIIAAARLSKQGRHNAQLALAEVLRSSAVDAQAVPLPEEVSTALQSVVLYLELKHGDDWQLMSDPEGLLVDRGKVCRMSRDMLEQLLALPPEMNGKVLRYIASTS